MTPVFRHLAASAFLLSVTAPLAAHDYQKGNLSIDRLWARETAQGQTTGGGFLTISNSGKTEDRLVGGSTPVAKELQIHSMVMDHGVMKMRRVMDGLPVPAGGTLELKPGSYHVMFIGLKGQLKPGTKVPATLLFRRAGAVKIELTVKSMAEAMTMMEHPK